MRALAVLFPAVMAAMCATSAAAKGNSFDKFAFVLLGEDGQAVARAITAADRCPELIADGRTIEMTLRAAPESEPLRPTQSAPDLSKSSIFSVRVCDSAIPLGTRHASVDGQQLALPSARLDRIVVIGDTGCRLKAKDNAWQACNDPARYPFAAIAAEAAAWKPDLVIHVGDYLYRENPCPQGNDGCAGSPWGYGWDAWSADFFTPAATLFAAAPWAVVRGNHESCIRAGQGWWRLLDPRPMQAKRNCNDPADDAKGDYSPPYAVPLGRGAQIVIIDLSSLGTKKIRDDDPRMGQLQKTAATLKRLSAHKTFTFVADHYPFFAVATDENADKGVKMKAGNEALRQSFARENKAVMPKGVDVLLAGHVHLWEQVDLGERQPSQFVAGFSGTQEDTVPLPAKLPSDLEPLDGTPIRRFSADIGSFGFMTLERTGRRSWRALVHGFDGNIVKRCRIKGRRSACRDEVGKK